MKLYWKLQLSVKVKRPVQIQSLLDMRATAAD